LPVSDYRDDRGALRQRIEALEAELEKSQGRVADLETDLERERAERDKPKPKLVQASTPLDKRRAQRVTMIVGAAVVVGAIGAGLAISLESTTRARQEDKPAAKPVVATPKPVPPVLAPWLTASSCRCAGEKDEGVELLYRANGAMSFGGNSTYFMNVALRTGELELQLAPGIDTVPPSKLEGGETKLLLACTKDKMVFAFGHRVSAWGMDDGKVAWSATLPAPVGQGKNGPLRIECETLEVKDDVIAIPHAGVVTKLAAKDGTVVQNQR
jgi:hypothetical protein